MASRIYRVSVSYKQDPADYSRNALLNVIAGDVMEAAKKSIAELESRGLLFCTVWSINHLGKIDIE